MSDSQQFLRELDKKLWSAADRLRADLDAAVYKHAVLGLIFLKYVSDSFAIRQREIEAQLRDPKSDYFADPTDYGGEGSADYVEVSRAVAQRFALSVSLARQAARLTVTGTKKPRRPNLVAFVSRSRPILRKGATV